MTRHRTAISGRRALIRTSPIIALLIASAAVPVSADAHDPDPLVSSSLFGQDQTVSFRWRPGAEPPTAVKNAVLAAAGDVAESRGSRAARFSYSASGDSPIGYGAGATCGVNGIACFTRSAPDGFTMWLREQGHIFDWGTLRWCQMTSGAPNGCYDVETIALDEFGHVEGLAHHLNYSDDRDYLDAVVQTYSRTKPKTGWNEHEFGRCDVATLQREYDVSSSSSAISTCLDLSTVVTLAASTTAPSPGASVRFSATLKIASHSDYDRLSGNNLSGRTVKLQRRTPGNSTWTSVLTLSSGSGAGTYTGSLTVSGSTEFRALFSAPSDEGLDGDGSPVVTVTPIAPCTGKAAFDRADAIPCLDPVVR